MHSLVENNSNFNNSGLEIKHEETKDQNENITEDAVGSYRENENLDALKFYGMLSVFMVVLVGLMSLPDYLNFNFLEKNVNTIFIEYMLIGFVITLVAASITILFKYSITKRSIGNREQPRFR